jgi:Na+/melibiose symporter-like transporter
MILLDYIPAIITASVLGILTTMFLKILSEHKNFYTSLKLTYLAIKIMLTFPFFLSKVTRKHRTDLLREINKDKSISDEAKKRLRKIISSDTRLFLFIFKASFFTFREVFEAFMISSSRYLKHGDNQKENLISKKSTNVIKFGIYKSVEPKLVEKLV